MTPCYPLALVSRRLLLTVLLLIAFLSLRVVTLAQSSTATLSGTVTDANNAVVPGAHVTATNGTTGLKREATTSGSGTFTIPLLPPSTYTVLVENQGFTPAEIKDVTLNVGDNVALNIQLKVGQVGATVDVRSEALLVDESPSVATTVDRQLVENIPLNGRTFQSLIALTPGVVLTKSNVNTPGQFSVNGQRSDANYFTVDGVSANLGVGGGSLGPGGGGSLPGLGLTGGTNNLVSVDALQEFRIQTSTYAPEFGRGLGAQVQIVTRSGTNKVHGKGFEYFRNDKLDANDWFVNAGRLTRSALRQNVFGFVLGRPVVLPRFGEGGQAWHSGRNRTFFFFSYEGFRLRVPQVSPSTDVPSLVARQLTPTALLPFVNAYPLPNGPNRLTNGQPNGLAQFSASFSNPSSLNATSIRIDHSLNNKLTVFGLYNYSPSNAAERGTGNIALSTVRLSDLKTQTLTGGATWAVTPRITDEVRGNWSRNETQYGIQHRQFRRCGCTVRRRVVSFSF